MKYWRGYIAAGLILAATLALMAFAKSHTVLIDMVYPYITRLIQTSLANWSGGVSFCLWQVLAVLLVVILLATAVLMVIMRWNFVQWLGWVLTGACALFFLHTGIYGLNTYAGPLNEDIRLTVKADEYDVTDMMEATTYFRDIANELAVQVPRNADGSLNYPAFAQLAETAGDGFEALTYEKYYSVFAGTTLPVKELGWADMYTSMGITGVTMGITGEAAVNPQIPDVSLPFTMCHEMAHRMCIAEERDANFAAFLSCSVNSSVEFRYSAYFMAYRYCYSALASSSGAEASAAAARVHDGAGELLRRDMNAYNQFFYENRSETAANIANTANDTYIKVSGDSAGIASYDQVCDLLVNWHIQQVVLPSISEEEQRFDPLDESQVDLSGIVNAS